MKAWWLVLILGVLVGGCTTPPQQRTIATYHGIAHGSDGRVWITGNTTTYILYGERLVILSSKNWVQACVEKAVKEASSLECKGVDVQHEAGFLPTDRLGDGGESGGDEPLDWKGLAF